MEQQSLERDIELEIAFELSRFVVLSSLYFCRFSKWRGYDQKERA